MIAEQELFVQAYRTNAWLGSESRSGIGASLAHTKVIRDALPLLFQELGIRTMVDIACGDFNWMSKVCLDDINYIGADIVEALIENNRRKQGKREAASRYRRICTGGEQA